MRRIFCILGFQNRVFMKTQVFKSILIFISATLIIFQGNAQIQIDTNHTAFEMVARFIGPGIPYSSNITYQGINRARGFFSNADSTNLGMKNGIFLCTGSGENIPGPNSYYDVGTANYIGGHPSLDNISNGNTYDASVLEFDFIPLNDTLRFRYVFGSEEYNEHVFSEYNDVCAVFLTGPNPIEGFYNDKNILIVPGTVNTIVSINNVNNGPWPPNVVPMGPCQNCQYFSDNTQGLTLEYDGFTTVLVAWSLVVPNEEYHMKIGIADVFNQGYDSGLFLEEQGLFSPGPAEFISFQFLMEHNTSLSFDVIGEVIDNDIFVEVPQGTDLSNLVASYEDKGAYVYVEEVLQSSGVTANNYLEPMIYQLHGHGLAEYTVYVDIVSDVREVAEPQIIVSPNPATDEVNFEIPARLYLLGEDVGSPAPEIEIIDMFGKGVKIHSHLSENNSNVYKYRLDTRKLSSGIYFYNFKIGEFQMNGKLVVQK